MKKGIIYFASNKVNDKVYIGQTVEKLEKRIKQHKTRNKNLPFSNSLNNHGKENFNFGTIEYPVEKLNEMEMYWIKKLKTKVPNGYNLTDGGESIKGYKFTEEQCKKISENSKRNWENHEVRKRIIKGVKTKWENPGYRKNQSEVQKKVQKIAQNRPEVRKRKSEKAKEMWENSEFRKNQSERMKKPEVRKRNSEAQKIAQNRPEVKKRKSKKAKIRWKNPEFKKKIYKRYIFTDPNKKEYYVDNGFVKFCKEHNLRIPNVFDVAKQRRDNYKGWTVKYAEV